MEENLESEKITTSSAPSAVGPYSQAVKFGNLVFCSGQIGVDPATTNLVAGGVTEEAKQVLKNLEQVLIAAGSNKNKVLQTTIYIIDMERYAEVNAAYSEVFKTEPLPARATIAISKLPKDAAIEISCIAYI